MGDNVDGNFEGKDQWYSGHITGVNGEGLFDLQYADGDVELSVPRRRIREQKFVVGDVVEVNCGGKGLWYTSEVIKVHVDGVTYDVKPGIKWISEEKVTGSPGQKYRKCLVSYMLLGWIVFSRQRGQVVVRRPPQPLSPRGFSVTRRVTKTRILPIQVPPTLVLIVTFPNTNSHLPVLEPLGKMVEEILEKQIVKETECYGFITCNGSLG